MLPDDGITHKPMAIMKILEREDVERMMSPNESQSAVPEKKVIVTIVAADHRRKIERKEVGILISAGRNVRPMTQRCEGQFLPRRPQKRNLRKGLKVSLTPLLVQGVTKIDKRRTRLLHRLLVGIVENHSSDGCRQDPVE